MLNLHNKLINRLKSYSTLPNLNIINSGENPIIKRPTVNQEVNKKLDNLFKKEGIPRIKTGTTDKSVFSAYKLDSIIKTQNKGKHYNSYIFRAK